MEKPAPDEIERLLLELKDDRRDVRSRAAYELGKHSDPRTIPPLISALSDTDKFVRSWAAGALGKAGSAAIAPLLTVIAGGDIVAGYYSALALGELGDLRAVPTLVRAIREGDYDIRPSAAGVLAKLGDAATLPDRVLSDTSLSPKDRIELLDSVRGLVYADEEVQLDYALPGLEQLCTERLRSTDDGVRAGAEETLETVRTAASEQTATVEPPVAAPASAANALESPTDSATPLPTSTGGLPEPSPAKPAPADPRPEPREDERPRPGFWSKLLGGGKKGS